MWYSKCCIIAAIIPPAKGAVCPQNQLYVFFFPLLPGVAFIRRNNFGVKC